jgi:valyl-tRNA synthetase
VPAGYAEDQRGVPGGFEAEVDILDTWATSSLTPQLAGGWQRDDELWNLVAPFDVRPQGQDIIRTWLFSTMLRSTLEDARSPWKHASVSGFIVDPDRKKMSKSKGNVVTPADILEKHGSDAVRYWAASSRLGVDAAFDPQNPTQMKIGRRLAIKILNAAKFVLSFPVPEGAEVSHALDASMLAALDEVVAEATKAFDAFDHARALEVTESFFWTFCDDYLELVKERAYDQGDVGQPSAALALRIALSTLLRLLAPVVSFATEEAWSWFEEGSVHTAAWPEPVSRVTEPAEVAGVLSAASAALIGIRRAKTEAKASQKTPVSRAVIAAPAESLEALRAAAGDLSAVGRIADLQIVEGDELAVTEIELAPAEQN